MGAVEELEACLVVQELLQPYRRHYAQVSRDRRKAL